MANRRKRRARRKQTIIQPRSSWWEEYSAFLFIGAGILIIVGFITWRELHIPLGDPINNPALMEQSRPFEIAYGDENAPVTMIEYASLTCGSCKHFHQDVVKLLELSYIRNGQVRYIFRHYPLNAPALDGALLLSCLPAEKTKPVIDTLFAHQDIWARADNPQKHLRDYFTVAGMSADDIQRCLDNDQRQEAIVAEQQKAREALHINSTPTVFINGRLYTGQKHFKATRRVIDGLLKRYGE